MAIWLTDCSLQSTFGRSASAIEVGGHCISPQEIVTRDSMENSFEDILISVFKELNIRPEDIETGWFGLPPSPFHLEVQPLCASTQVNDIGACRVQHREFTFFDMSFSTQINECSGEFSAGCGNSSKTKNAFEFDVNSFMPSGPAFLSKLDDSSTLKETETVGNSPDLKSEDSSNKHEVVDCSKSRVDAKLQNKAQTQQATDSPDAAFASRLKFKFSEFTFTESHTNPLEYSTRATCSDQTEPTMCGSSESSPPTRARTANQKDCLNFVNLAPEDWNFANIDTDFDL